MLSKAINEYQYLVMLGALSVFSYLYFYKPIWHVVIPFVLIAFAIDLLVVLVFTDYQRKQKIQNLKVYYGYLSVHLTSQRKKLNKSAFCNIIISILGAFYPLCTVISIGIMVIDCIICLDFHHSFHNYAK